MKAAGFFRSANPIYGQSSGVLLDTCALIHGMAGTLPNRAKAAIKNAEERYVSVIAPLEIQLKRSLAKELSPQLITMAIHEMALHVQPIHLAHIWRLGTLPHFSDHRDPFDRLLIAQAYSHNLAVVTNDRQFLRYPDLDVIWN